MIFVFVCLFILFEVVEIYDFEIGWDEVYWDGGYLGNFVLFLLFFVYLFDDVLIVSINLLYCEILLKDSVLI